MPHVQTSDLQPLSAKSRVSPHAQDRALQRALREGVADALGLGDSRQAHGLAEAIREKLQKAGAGADATPALLETLNRALDDAAAKLAAQGVARGEIDAGLARFRNKLASEIGELAGPAQPSADQPLAREKSAIAAREVLRERFSMDILTTEGDKVSIRFQSLSVTEVAVATATHAGGSAFVLEADVISRGRFKVAVDGNLNAEERAAIGNLLDKVDDIANDFFGGDVEAAFAAAARVKLDANALGAFDLRLGYSRGMAVARTYTSNAKPGGEPVKLPAEAPAPAPRPAPGRTPAAGTPATPPAATLVPTPPAEIAAPVLDSAPVKTPDAAPASEGAATTAAAANATAKAISALETITSFTRDVFERLEKDDESDAVKFSLRWKVEFLVKSFGSVALTQAEQKAAEALGIALDGPTPGA